MERDELRCLVDHITVANNLADQAELLARIRTVRGPTILSFINANTMNLARDNNALLYDLLGSSLLLRDGIGMSILLLLIGKSPGLNSNGTDFIPRVALQFKGRSVALLGTEDVYVRRAAEYTQRFGCRVVVAENGFHEPESYSGKVKKARPELIVLGMGSPKQECVARIIARSADYPVVIVNGGAILDRWAGRFRRAPPIVRQLRAEWLFRLMLEPRRLWRRYLIGNGRFLAWAVGLAIDEVRHANATTDQGATRRAAHTVSESWSDKQTRPVVLDLRVASNSDGLPSQESSGVGSTSPR
jgi:N-acetylglucosaminyldiphosphoundecaprenol N-acetyl-beta-D-mannosaminyltransferase